MDVQSILVVIAGGIAVLVGIGGLVATIWAIGRVKGIEQSVDILNLANEGLRQANDDLRFELRESAAECAERVTRLEATNDALTDGLGQKLADAIAARFESTMAKVADRIVDGIAHRSTDRQERFGHGEA